MPAKKKPAKGKLAEVVSAKTMTAEEKHDRISKVMKERRGRVFIYAPKVGLVPIKKKEKLTSKQLKEDKKYWREKGLVSPPYDPDGFLTYYESCIYFMRTVDQIAQDVAGQGYKLEPEEGVDLDKDEKAKEFKEKAEKLLDSPNDEYDLIEMIKRLIIDWGSVGWMNMELVPNESLEVGSMYHAPAYSIRVHEDRKKYCQTRYVRGQRKRMWFKKFGESDEINEETGEVQEKRDDKSANWMIMDLNYYQRSDYYGTPNILGALGAVISLIGIRDFNLSFFENFGVPAALVILYGDWEEGSDKGLTEFIESEIRGSENAYKTLVLQAPETKETATGAERKGIEWIPLMAEIREGTFMKDYYIHMRDETLVAYSMPSYRVGITEQGSLGGSTAEESTKIYMGSIVEALQQKVENIFNFRILPTLLDKPTDEDETAKVPLLFKLIAPDIRNKDAEVARAIKLFEHAALTVDELRTVEGKEPLGDKEGGEDRYILKGLRKIGEEEYEEKEEELLRVTQDLEGRVKTIEEKKK